MSSLGIAFAVFKTISIYCLLQYASNYYNDIIPSSEKCFELILFSEALHKLKTFFVNKFYKSNYLDQYVSFVIERMSTSMINVGRNDSHPRRANKHTGLLHKRNDCKLIACLFAGLRSFLLSLKYIKLQIMHTFCKGNTYFTFITSCFYLR